MSEDALQRVVHLVRDAGDELAERRELLRLREPPAQRFALGLELRLRGDVARDEHAPDRLPSRLMSGVTVAAKMPPSRSSVN